MLTMTTTLVSELPIIPDHSVFPDELTIPNGITDDLTDNLTDNLADNLTDNLTDTLTDNLEDNLDDFNFDNDNSLTEDPCPELECAVCGQLYDHRYDLNVHVLEHLKEPKLVLKRVKVPEYEIHRSIAKKHTRPYKNLISQVIEPDKTDGTDSKYPAVPKIRILLPQQISQQADLENSRSSSARSYYSNGSPVNDIRSRSASTGSSTCKLEMVELQTLPNESQSPSFPGQSPQQPLQHQGDTGFWNHNDSHSSDSRLQLHQESGEKEAERHDNLLQNFLNDSADSVVSSKDPGMIIPHHETEYISLDRLAGPQCSVCGERYVDQAAFDLHCKATGHYSNSLVPYGQSSMAVQPSSMSNPLDSLTNLPMQQLAQQVNRLQQGQVTKLSGAQVHQQNVLINIQQFGHGMPPPGPPPYGGGDMSHMHHMGHYGQQQPQPPHHMYMPHSQYHPAPPPHAPPPHHMYYGGGAGMYGPPPPHPAGPTAHAPGQHPPGQQPPQHAGPAGAPPQTRPQYHREPSNMMPPRLPPPRNMPQQMRSPMQQQQQQQQPQVRPPPMPVQQPARQGGTPPRPQIRGNVHPRPMMQNSQSQQPGIRGPSIQQQRMMLQQKRNHAAQEQQQQQMKKKRLDVLIPDTNDDADCHVISMQKCNDGLPIIKNVQGAATTAADGIDPVVHLTDSITLSVRNPKETAPVTQQKKNDAKAVANILATRGITVTPATKSQKEGSPNSTKSSAAPVAINLNSAVSIIPTARNQQGNKPASNGTSDKPGNKPQQTVDLTEDDPSSLQKGGPATGKRTLPHQCDLCPAQYPSMRTLMIHRRQYHKAGPQSELGVPIVDLSQPTVLSKLASLGIHSYIPLPQTGQGNNATFALPIVSVNSARNPNICNISALGSGAVLTLGPLHHISNLPAKQ